MAGSGETNFSFLVKNANFADAGFSANGGDNVIQLIPMIFQHAVARAAFDGVTDPIGARDGDLLEVFPMQLHNLISQDEENNCHASNQTQREFQAQIE